MYVSLFDRPIGVRYTLRFCVRQGHLVILSSSSEKFSHDQLSDQEVGKWQQQSQSSQQQSLILDQMLYEETITIDYYFFSLRTAKSLSSFDNDDSSINTSNSHISFFFLPDI